MPDMHEGLDSSPDPYLQGDLSDSAGSQPHRDAKIFSWRRGSSEPARLQLSVHVNSGDAAECVPLHATNWARLGQSIWKANRDAFDAAVPRDVPAWLAGHWAPPNRLHGNVQDDSLQDVFLEDPLPLHFGLEMNQPALREGSPLSTGAGGTEWSRRASSTTDSSCAPLLQFPLTVVPIPWRQQASSARFEDGVLPFRAPVKQTIAVFSLAGGTGRTSLAAGLARLLAGTGLRVLLADTSSYSLLPRLFGSAESRQGVVRNFFPSTGDRNRMVSLISLAVDPFAGDDYEQYRILEELSVQAGRMDRVIWDLSGAPLDWAAKVLGTNPQILVPLLPSTNSLMQLRATERFVNRCHDEEPSAHLRYVLNHFDADDVLHHDIRDRFQRHLGSKLLRVSMRSSPLVDEALACGKTVIDHAPVSSPAGDLWHLAQQLHQVEESAEMQPNVPSEWFEH